MYHLELTEVKSDYIRANLPFPSSYGYINKLNTSKHSKLFDISKETASKDLIDLYKKEILDKLTSGGRETAYYIKEFGLPNEKEFGRSKQIRN